MHADDSQQINRPEQARFAALRPSRFDLTVAAIVIALLAAIGLTLLAGDRVGVQIERYSPDGLSSSTARVNLVFSEAMNWDSVIDHLTFTPALQGEFHSNNKTLRFTPSDPLAAGESYQVSLSAGAMSESGRQVLDDLSFSFNIRTPRVAYLAPADQTPQNIWLADPADPGSAEQITFSPNGILNFDVSPDGSRIAFAERSTIGTSDIKLLDLASGSIEQVTHCADADCNTPVWRPDGTLIAYHRVDLNSDLGAVGVSPTRIWLIDLTTSPATERPLFDNNQILGFAPQWSADGQKIALYDNSSRAIILYSLEDGRVSYVPSQNGGSDMALSPDGSRVVYPRLIFDQETGSARSVLEMADTNSEEVEDLFDPDSPIDDGESIWHPDGQHLVIARRYTDDRATQTRQLYYYDTFTGDLEPLVIDPRYYNGFFSWDAAGQQLVIQRFPQFTEDGDFNNSGKPEVWTYTMAGDTLIQLAQNAYLPRWVP